MANRTLEVGSLGVVSGRGRWENQGQGAKHFLSPSTLLFSTPAPAQSQPCPASTLAVQPHRTLRPRRTYTAGSGHFLQVDPGYDYDPMDPMSWNLYAYVRGNPIVGVDRTGEFEGNFGTSGAWDPAPGKKGGLQNVDAKEFQAVMKYPLLVAAGFASLGTGAWMIESWGAVGGTYYGYSTLTGISRGLTSDKKEITPFEVLKSNLMAAYSGGNKMFYTLYQTGYSYYLRGDKAGFRAILQQAFYNGLGAALGLDPGNTEAAGVIVDSLLDFFWDAYDKYHDKKKFLDDPRRVPQTLQEAEKLWREERERIEQELNADNPVGGGF